MEQYYCQDDDWRTRIGLWPTIWGQFLSSTNSGRAINCFASVIVDFSSATRICHFIFFCDNDNDQPSILGNHIDAMMIMWLIVSPEHSSCFDFVISL
jgi:hypothetical protein